MVCEIYLHRPFDGKDTSQQRYTPDEVAHAFAGIAASYKHTITKTANLGSGFNNELKIWHHIDDLCREQQGAT